MLFRSRLLIAILVLAAATYGRYWLVTWLGERVIADLRKAVYNHLLSLSPAFYETARSGDILSRLSADTGILQTLIATSISYALRNGVLLTGGLTMMMLTSPKLTGMVLFNAYLNGAANGGQQDPVVAGTSNSNSGSGASLSQSIVGLAYQGPHIWGGGQINADARMDFFGGSSNALNHLVRGHQVKNAPHPGSHSPRPDGLENDRLLRQHSRANGLYVQWPVSFQMRLLMRHAA